MYYMYIMYYYLNFFFLLYNKNNKNNKYNKKLIFIFYSISYYEISYKEILVSHTKNPFFEWSKSTLLTKNFMYWEYKFSPFKHAFISKQNEWTDQLKYCPSLPTTFFPSLRQFSNSISKKWLVFGGDPILEPIFWISAKEVNRWLAASFGTTSNQKEQYPENTGAL